jgi:hypothetical protein
MMNQLTDSPGARSRIVIIGAGYAGYHCARHLERRLPREAAEIVIVSPTDYMPYTSLPAPGRRRHGRSAAYRGLPVGHAAAHPPHPRPRRRR